MKLRPLNKICLITLKHVCILCMYVCMCISVYVCVYMHVGINVYPRGNPNFVFHSLSTPAISNIIITSYGSVANHVIVTI